MGQSQVEIKHSIAYFDRNTFINGRDHTHYIDLPSLVPRPFIGETARQLTRVQTVYGYDVKEMTAPLVQAMNIG